jgi:serine/threonine protein kinase
VVLVNLSAACPAAGQAPNFLLGQDGYIKLADFGVAKSIMDGNTSALMAFPVSHCDQLLQICLGLQPCLLFLVPYSPAVTHMLC